MLQAINCVMGSKQSSFYLNFCKTIRLYSLNLKTKRNKDRFPNIREFSLFAGDFTEKIKFVLQKPLTFEFTFYRTIAAKCIECIVQLTCNR